MRPAGRRVADSASSGAHTCTAQRTASAAEALTPAAACDLAAPAGTPEPVIQRLNKEMLAVLAMPDLRERFASLGMEPLGSTPAEFGAFVRSEIKRLGEVVRASGARIQ